MEIIIGLTGMAVCVVVMMAAIMHRGKEQYHDEPNTTVSGAKRTEHGMVGD